MADIGISIPAIGIDPGVVSRCRDSILSSVFDGSVEVLISRRPKTALPNISRARNDGIRSLIETCDIIGCLDADLIMQPGLIEEAIATANNGNHHWQCPSDSDGVVHIERLCGKGGWNAMTRSNWLKVGGWDERCFGWGGEDDILHRDICSAGIKTVKSSVPLIHPRHTARCIKRGQHNIRVAAPTALNWLVPNCHMCLHITSACNLNCNHCAMRDLMNSDPGYSMSIGEVGRWISETDRAGYKFDTIVLTGGEPTMNNDLPEIARMIQESCLCNNVKMFTNGFRLGEMNNALLPWINLLAVSFHGQKIPDLSGWGDRAWVADRTQHTPRPLSMPTGTLPADCVGGIEFCLYDGVVYGCPTALSSVKFYGVEIESRKATGRYLDELMSVDHFNQPRCRACTANQKVRNMLHSQPV